MDNNTPVQTTDWRNTKEAAANFRQLLLCSKCQYFQYVDFRKTIASNLLKEPVCLGMCEHMLCRSCAGPRAGDGCVVCHSPAWVKDIQINRQLSSIIQLFSGFESLFNPVEQQDSSLAETPPQSESSVFKQKKNFKIWFSPRSRKVRCMVEKPSEVTAPEFRSSIETTPTQPATVTAQCQDLSVFNFSSSSQDSDPSCSPTKNENRNKKRSVQKNASSVKMSVKGPTRTTRKQTKQVMKKNRLEAINQLWGITDEVDPLKEKEQPCAEGKRRSSKKVSFLSPAVTSDDSQREVPQGSVNELGPGRSTISESPSGSCTAVNDQTQSGQSMSGNITQHEKLSPSVPNSSVSPKKQDVSPPKHSSKRSRVEEKVASLETTPKRPRASPSRRKSLLSPAVLNPPSSGSPRCAKSVKALRQEQGHSPSPAAGVGRKSPSTPRSSTRRLSPGSPAFMKKNHKGETPLHLAAIKGDVEAVKELLDQGADPNLKDNAGWTPLHEACNLGHQAVVEVLVSKGALLNTPGYENDSPLHDAVRNGHLAVVKVLLQLGASQNVLNLHGKRPADYAVSPDMLKIFQEASATTEHTTTSISPSATLPAVSDCVGKEEIVFFLSSKLSQPEQHQLGQLGALLGGKIVDTFSSSVSHIVLPEGHMPTTFSTLLGILAGCWVVRFSWVEACLQAGERTPETEHEAGEGPQRSRINRCSLLPPLFDGCFFFLLGSFKAPSKDELTKLLREGGGQLLNRQPKPDSDVTQTMSAAAYHALPGSDQALCTQYIIFDDQGRHRPAVLRRGKVWSAPSSWIISCVAAFRLLPVPDPQTKN